MVRKLVVLLFFLWITPVHSADIPVNAGDILKITVYNNSDLTSEVQVSSAGAITFPLIGLVNISGLSPRDVEKKIAFQLVNKGFLRKAQVNVIVIDSKSQRVSVLGQVRSPGKYSIDASTNNIIDFISLAGGKTVNAGNKVIVIKQAATKPIRYEMNLDLLIKKGDLDLLTSGDLDLSPGDILYVPQAPVFYVYGEVNRPGSYQLQEQMTVAQALSLGGGITTRGTESGLLIKRKNKKGALITIDATDVTEVKEDDVIYVKESLF